MHLKITTRTYKGKVYRQASIVQGYRKGSYVSQRTIRNLGPVKDSSDELRYRELMNKMKQGKILVSLHETNSQVLEYGVRLAVEHLWNLLGLEPFLLSQKISYDINQIILMLITHRLHHYGSENISEREAHRWMCQEAHTSLQISLKQVYRSLFILLKKKEQIEKHLCEKLDTKKEIVFYDLTSSYVEGAYKESDLVNFGYNRDKKRGKKQIVLGLLLADKLPLAHKVWEGNTADKTTLKEAVKQLQSLGIKRFIFVADRGIFTDKNIDWIEEQKLEYIMATRRRKDELVQKLMRKPINTSVLKVYEEGKKHYYLCYNKDVAKLQIEELRQHKEELLEKLSKLRKPTEHKVLITVGKAKRIFTFSFEGGFSYKINEEAYDYEKTIAGKFLLVTNNGKLQKEEVFKTYKQLIDVEYCFRELKHFEDMRPLFHKSDNGLKAHILICVLTLLIEKMINKAVPNMTTRQVITELKKIKLSKTNEYLVRTDITDIQKEIIKKLKVQEPTKII